MKKYVIERDLPGVGASTDEQMRGVARTSCAVLAELGPQVQWIESQVTRDRIYCLYLAENEEVIREHARRGGFPANRISEVLRTIDPTTATLS